MFKGLPREGRAALAALLALLALFALFAQQALAASACWAGAASLNTGMLPSVWKCSQATPCGSVTQCFSLWA
jgi:hypothetical protein